MAKVLAKVFGPTLAARMQFPGLTPDQRQAQIRALTDARPGPCQSAYDRRPHPDNHRRELPFRGVSGRAMFTCLYDLQVQGHGALRAVIRQEFLTNLHRSWRPPEPQVRSGNEGRYLITALERQRRAPAGNAP